MKSYALLISPLVKGAFFRDYLNVIHAELVLFLAGEGVTNNDIDIDTRIIGDMEFVTLRCNEEHAARLTVLSFIQGMFEYTDNTFQPLPLSAHYFLHEDFVFGAKYKGKTNEVLTQLLLNLGLAQLARNQSRALRELLASEHKIKVLDPMCGRATTLMWAMRYGLNSKGIEHDVQVLADLRQNLKKWCKIHRIKHSLKEGFVNKSNRKKSGKFLEFSNTKKSAQVICGDARDAHTLLKSEKFDLIVSDLPYGVQHTTRDGRYNPIDTMVQCSQSWKKCLKKHGVIVLSFNKHQPKRTALIQAFCEAGFAALDFEAPHRMSESIIRDIAIFVPDTLALDTLNFSSLAFDTHRNSTINLNHTSHNTAEF